MYKMKSDINFSLTHEMLENAENETVEFEGPHPAGNVGVQINHIKPVNKGEVVWTVNATDVILMGRLFNKGVADFTRLLQVLKQLSRVM